MSITYFYKYKVIMYLVGLPSEYFIYFPFGVSLEHYITNSIEIQLLVPKK
jgi:hypothetical protein